MKAKQQKQEKIRNSNSGLGYFSRGAGLIEMNKYELKYLEDESTKVKDLIDINGKNAHHIQDLYEEIKELKIHNKKLIVRMNDKTEENIKLKNIIRSQQEKTC